VAGDVDRADRRDHVLRVGRVVAVLRQVFGFMLWMATLSPGVARTQRALSGVDGIPSVPPRSEPPGGQDVSQRERSAIEPDAVAAAIERTRRNRSAFAELYDAYFARVYGYVATRLGSRSDAEDVVADTFVRALDALPRFEYRGPGSFAAWLFRIAHNRVLTESAKHRHLADLDPDAVTGRRASLVDQSPEATLEQAEDAQLIRRLIQSLSPRRQEVVTLRFFGGLRNREIAQVLGLDERTVASHLCRALDDLRTKYLDATE
jgi:RNA polymerase sigma-70 factor (ECF subfamily)